MAGALDFQEWSREELAGLAGWTPYREARAIVESGGVSDLDWKFPVLQGSVRSAADVFHAQFEVRSRVFPVNRCDCPVGRRRQVCVHAIALCLAFQRGGERPAVVPVSSSEATDPEPSEPEATPLVQSLQVAAEGEAFAFRIILPPNLEAAAQRNAVIVKLEYETPTGALAPEKVGRQRRYALGPSEIQLLQALEGWCGGTPYSLLQLKTAQLLEVLESPAKVTLLKGGGGLIEEGERTAVLLPMVRGAAERLAEAAPRARSRPPSRPAESPQPRPAPLPVLPQNWMVVDGSTQYLAILLRDREHPQYRGCADWLRAEGFRKEPSNGKWWLRDAHKVLNFLALHRVRLERDYDVAYTENFKERTRSVTALPLVVEAEPVGDQYTLRVELKAAGLDLMEVRRALVTGRHYIAGPDRVYLLEQAAVERLRKVGQTLGPAGGMELTGKVEVRLKPAEWVHAEQVLDELEVEAELPADWKSRSAAIREVGKLAEPPVPEQMAARLRTYQLVGVAWLWHLYQNRLGGILADEMGLGKTIQAIALMGCWKRTGDTARSCLVVAPAGLLGNWQRELRTWAPELAVYLHHGPDRLQRFPEPFEADVCLTSYSTLRNDRALFESRSHDIIIADEAQHVKNRRSHASRSLRALSADAKFVLTGTPIENSVDDLRSLFDFCLPGYLRQQVSDLRGEERVAHERQQVSRAAPYILRRAKRMVAPELPEKIEQTIWCDLGALQRGLYQRVREQTERSLMQMAASGASENRMRFAMLTELLRLRQICADPGMLDEAIPLEESAKFLAFRELLEEALDGGHRVLVFSQFVRLLKRLQAWLEAEQIGTAYIDGSTRDRLKVCERFNSDKSQALCLISLKAGGTGLNLTGADTVIHFDPWWNPAVEDQATDRAHRIGQTRTVTSYKLVTEATVEEKVIQLQLKKSALLQDLLDESSLQSAKVDLLTLKALLSE
ncbi:MAG: hypothetical protein RL648_350 [Verrucomicrobiota bacterium]